MKISYQGWKKNPVIGNFRFKKRFHHDYIDYGIQKKEANKMKQSGNSRRKIFSYWIFDDALFIFVL